MKFKNFFNPKPEDFFKKINREMGKIAQEATIDLENCQIVSVKDDKMKVIGIGFLVDGKVHDDFVKIDDVNIAHSYINYLKSRYEDRVARDTRLCAGMIETLYKEMERKHGIGLPGIKLALISNHKGAKGFAFTKKGELASDVIKTYDAVILKLADTLVFDDLTGDGEEAVG